MCTYDFISPDQKNLKTSRNPLYMNCLMSTLKFRICKYSFFFYSYIILSVVPVLYKCRYLLTFWLEFKVQQTTTQIVRLSSFCRDSVCRARTYFELLLLFWWHASKCTNNNSLSFVLLARLLVNKLVCTKLYCLPHHLSKVHITLQFRKLGWLWRVTG